MDLGRSAVRAGIWFASDPRRVLGTVGVVWMNTLAGPVGAWSRAMTWGAIRGTATTAASGLAFTARTTWSRLLVPAALSAPVQTAAIIAAPIAVAAIASGAVTAAYQSVELIGPDAPKASSAFPSTKGAKINPFQMGWGSVV